MTIITKNKKGFTLVEVILAVAIICLISGLFVQLLISINGSYNNVYNSNDSADYAMLYSQALENSVVRDCQSPVAATFQYRIVDNVLKRSADGSDFEPVFTLTSMRSRNGADKWKVELVNVFYYAETSMLSYDIKLTDQYANPGAVQTYRSAFWLPIHNGATGIGSNTYQITTGGAEYGMNFTMKVTPAG